MIFQVLFLVDPIDEVAIQNLKSYKEKNFVDISKEDLDLGLYLDLQVVRIVCIQNVARLLPLCFFLMICFGLCYFRQTLI